MNDFSEVEWIERLANANVEMKLRPNNWTVVLECLCDRQECWISSRILWLSLNDPKSMILDLFVCLDISGSILFYHFNQQRVMFILINCIRVGFNSNSRLFRLIWCLARIKRILGIRLEAGCGRYHWRYSLILLFVLLKLDTIARPNWTTYFHCNISLYCLQFI